jgi:riboflavin kinase / FMN adenylyltransferase
VQIPGTGVYAVRMIYQNKSYDAVANIGFNPTFDRDRLSVEVHIFDFNQVIYGKEIEVEFIERIRSEIEFKSKDELVVQINKDIDKARILLKESK